MGYISIFFFQAEDGIRDYKVTGVQTCALPISWLSDQELAKLLREVEADPNSNGYLLISQAYEKRGNMRKAMLRSEERRVGKERGSGRRRRENKKKIRGSTHKDG